MKRVGNPNWVKGQSANPKGRAKGSYAIHTQLEKAISKVEKDKQIKVYEHFVERALKNDTVLVALLRKLVPDRHFTEGDKDITKIVNIIHAYGNGNNKPLPSTIRNESVRQTQQS